MTKKVCDQASAEKIRRLRKATKMSQTELAKYIGVSRRTVVYWERGEMPCRGPALNMLLLLANAHSELSVRRKDEPDAEWVYFRLPRTKLLNGWEQILCDKDGNKLTSDPSESEKEQQHEQ